MYTLLGTNTGKQVRRGCLLFVGSNRLEWTLINGKEFSKIREPAERGSAYHLKFGFLLLFSVDERQELGSRANGKEISDVPFRTEKEDNLWR